MELVRITPDNLDKEHICCAISSNKDSQVVAPGYMYIDCLWVAGKFKGQGYSRQLLGECIRDSKEKGKKGLVIVSSPKKMAYLSDKKYLLHHGFRVADQADPYFELLYLSFEEDAEVPQFRRQVKCREIKAANLP